MLDHEKLDVYQLSLAFVSWSYDLCRQLKGMDRHARDQLLRASQSIPLNIAEGNGKLPTADRKRFLRIALGSALECGAVLDVLVACETISIRTVADGKRMLQRIVAMLTKMTSVGTQLKEESAIDYEIASEELGNH